MQFCKICETDKNSDKFIYPCLCKEPVHKACLNKIRSITTKNTCKICKKKFKLNATEEMKSNCLQMKNEAENIYSNFYNSYFKILNRLSIIDNVVPHTDCVNKFIFEYIVRLNSIFKDLEYLDEWKEYETFVLEITEVSYKFIRDVKQIKTDFFSSILNKVYDNKINTTSLEDMHEQFFRRYLEFISDSNRIYLFENTLTTENFV